MPCRTLSPAGALYHVPVRPLPWLPVLLLLALAGLLFGVTLAF